MTITNAKHAPHPRRVSSFEFPTQSAVGWRQHIRSMAKRLGTRMVQLVNDYAEAHGAASLYAELSRLSDSELRERGLTRGELHHWIFTSGK
jgi:hypothetical protein